MTNPANLPVDQVQTIHDQRSAPALGEDALNPRAATPAELTGMFIELPQVLAAVRLVDEDQANHEENLGVFLRELMCEV